MQRFIFFYKLKKNWPRYHHIVSFMHNIHNLPTMSIHAGVLQWWDSSGRCQHSEWMVQEDTIQRVNVKSCGIREWSEMTSLHHLQLRTKRLSFHRIFSGLKRQSCKQIEVLVTLHFNFYRSCLTREHILATSWVDWQTSDWHWSHSWGC